MRTLEKIPPWVKVSDRKGKSVAKLVFKECFEGSIYRNMELALGQRRKDDTCDVIKSDKIRLLPCEFLRAQRR
jgi:hypothetical protein